MDSVDPHNGGPCNLTLRDITNTEEQEALTFINDSSDRKGKRPFHQSPLTFDTGENEVIHPPKAYEAPRHVKGKVLVSNAKQYDSLSSKGNDKSQGERLVDKLSLRGVSSGQTSRLSSEADDSSIGPLANSSCEDEDTSTESDEPKENIGSDEQFLRHPVHPVKDHEEPSFSEHTSLDRSIPSKKKADVEEIFTHKKLQNISLCGSCPCSACIKAAYMWSDLIYQDARGRLNALKSSRRQARILEGKILRQEKAGETSQSQLKKSKSTESDLLQHWTALLHHTEDTLLREIVQTQSGLVEMEKLKERLKRDVETLSSAPTK